MTVKEWRALCISILATPIVYILLTLIAYHQRGYVAFGGECMAWLIPLYAYTLICAR